jgi:phospholipid-binding lipoprotein MlaA
LRVRPRIGTAVVAVALLCAVASIARGAPSANAPSGPDPLFDDDVEPAAGFPDPIEGVNRATFRFNQEFDAWIIDPMMRGYRFVVPAPGRQAIRRALINLDSPVTIANDLLQLEPGDALVTVARFAINSTVGIGGLFDVAEHFDLPGHQSDFGQTLALSGVGSGPYLVLPFLGPSNARDGTGFMVDFLFRPTTYLVTPGGAVFLTSFGAQSGQNVLVTTLFQSSAELAEGLATREAAGAGLAALESSSIDYYAALRSAYYQNRVALIWRRGPDHGPLALARRGLARLSLGATGGEVGDLGVHGSDQPVEPVALEH